MLPPTTQRLLLALSVLLGGLVFLTVAGAATASAGATGCTLLTAASVTSAMITFIIAGLVAVGLGLIVCTTGHPMAGPFVVGAAMLFAAAQGGTSEHWLMTNELPGGFLTLAMELGIWSLPVLVSLWLAKGVRQGLRAKLPAKYRFEHFTDDVGLEPPKPTANSPKDKDGLQQINGWLVAVGFMAVAQILLLPQLSRQVLFTTLLAGGLQSVLWSITRKPVKTDGEDPHTRTENMQGLMGCWVATFVFASTLVLFVQHYDVGQVIGGLLLASIVAATLARLVAWPTPKLNLMLNPLIVGLAGYVVMWIVFRGENAEAIRGAAFRYLGMHGGTWMGPFGLVLPVYYASAGVAGSAIGLGWAQGMKAMAAKQAAVEPAA